MLVAVAEEVTLQNPQARAVRAVAEQVQQAGQEPQELPILAAAAAVEQQAEAQARQAVPVLLF